MKQKSSSSGSISYKEVLSECLQDPKEVIGYLNECLKDEDPSVFLLALQDVIMAHGATIPEALSCEIIRLYDFLAEQDKVRFKGMSALLNAFEIRLTVQ